MFKYYEENKRLKKELEDLRKRYAIIINQNDIVFQKIDYYKYKFEEEEKTSQKLRYKVCELLHQNTYLLEENAKLLEEKNNKLAKKNTDDTTDKIKEFINELEHNIQVDKDNGETLISGVSCDYVIERLKDIIK